MQVPFLKHHFKYEEISSPEFQEMQDDLAAVFRSIYDHTTAASVLNGEYRIFYKVGGWVYWTV